MPEIALVLYLAYLALAFGLRTAVHVRRTGSSGFVGLRGRFGSVEWTGGVLFAVAVVLGLVAPLLTVAGGLAPVPALDGPVGHAAGLGLAVTGTFATLVAQLAMGDAWRIGVDPEERTTLVTDGPFAVVRNPIFAAMIPVSIGLALLCPNAAAFAGLAVLVLALQIQTRGVEEPYLRRTHGAAYEAYCARVGRFVPRLSAGRT